MPQLTAEQAALLASLGGGITFPSAKVDNFQGARPFRIVVGTAGDAWPVYSGRCLLVGMLLIAGAATATARAYDLGWSGSVIPGVLKPDVSNRRSAVKAAIFDGWINFPVLIENGLVCDLDQTDAELYVYYVPAPSSG